MIYYLLSIIAAMFAATPDDRCLYDNDDTKSGLAADDAKAAIDMPDPMANPLDGFAPPPSIIPYLIPPTTQTEFQQ